MGVLDVKNPEKCCLWFKRNLVGIEDDTPSRPLSRYIGKVGYFYLFVPFINDLFHILEEHAIF